MRSELRTVITNLVVVWALGQIAGAPARIETSPPPARMQISADLGGKGRLSTVRLDTMAGDPVTLTEGGRTVSFGIRARWRPWRITTADLVGNGRREIVVALYKSTLNFRQPHNTLFVYRWDGAEVHPLWLGSSLGKPFTDFAFAGASAYGDRLVSLDIDLDGRRSITIHRWRGFGFNTEASWGRWRTARLISVREGRITVLADGKQLVRSLEAK